MPTVSMSPVDLALLSRYLSSGHVHVELDGRLIGEHEIPHLHVGVPHKRWAPSNPRSMKTTKVISEVLGGGCGCNHLSHRVPDTL